MFDFSSSWLDTYPLSFLPDPKRSIDSHFQFSGFPPCTEPNPSVASPPSPSLAQRENLSRTASQPLQDQPTMQCDATNTLAAASPEPATRAKRGREADEDDEDDWFSRRHLARTTDSSNSKVEAKSTTSEREWDRPKRLAGWDLSSEATPFPRLRKRLKTLYLPERSDGKVDDRWAPVVDGRWAPAAYSRSPPSTSRAYSIPSTSPEAPRPRSRRHISCMTDSLDDLWRQVSARDVEPYLLRSERIDNAWSTTFLRALARFLSSCSPPSRWRDRPVAGLNDRRSFLPAAERTGALDLEPDREKIRRMFPLCVLDHVEPDFPERATWLAMQKALRWVWDTPANLRHVAWLAEEAPLPLFALVRVYAAVARFRHAVTSAWSECTSYLLDPLPSAAPLTSREQRAAVLVSWLNAGGDARKALFFTDEEGPLPPPAEEERSVEAWEWWWEEPWALWGPRELDEWEREREREQDGRDRWRGG
ncbi:hypothetical protein JCM10207_001471 [Rhodosporidiobolus poonsookiae]